MKREPTYTFREFLILTFNDRLLLTVLAFQLLLEIWYEYEH